jgi:hypothetical protein
MAGWNVKDVVQWASSIVGPEVAQKLAEQQIDGQVLLGTQFFGLFC